MSEETVEVVSESVTSSYDAGNDSLFKEMGIDPAKYGITEDEPVSAPEGVAQGSAEDQDQPGHENDEKSYLDWVNSLGAQREGQPVKVESIDELKNAVQMFKDYTVKTQALSDERKVFETEYSGAKAEIDAAIKELDQSREKHQKELQELQQWAFTFEQLKTSAPDLFEEVQAAYQGTAKQFSNPVLNQQLAAMRAELDSVKKGLTSREDEAILKSFETDKAALSATEQSLNELGVKVNWDEVKKQWAQTGMPVKQVLGTLYFDQVAKAQASKAKVETVKAKTSARPAGAAAASRPGSKVPNISGSRDYLAAAHQLLQNMR